VVRRNIPSEATSATGISVCPPDGLRRWNRTVAPTAGRPPTNTLPDTGYTVRPLEQEAVAKTAAERSVPIGTQRRMRVVAARSRANKLCWDTQSCYLTATAGRMKIQLRIGGSRSCSDYQRRLAQ